MNINFYNHFHNGDIFLSKKFILDIIKKTNCNKPIYYHKNTPLLLKDISSLIEQNNNIDHLDCNISYFSNNETIYINTWIGTNNKKYYNGINNKALHCSLYAYYEMFKNIYNFLNIKLEEISYYIPVINFKNIDTLNIDLFLSQHNNKKVLICGGNVLSGQSNNFNFDDIIDNLSSTYENIIFIATHKTNLKKPNLFYTEDIIKLDRDLVEISYLSTFCDIIIGRASGPHTFTYIKDNIFNPNKTNISICHYEYDGKWFLESSYNNIWTNNYNKEYLLNLIKSNIIKINGKNIF
jgi:hypothetical protein